MMHQQPLLGGEMIVMEDNTLVDGVAYDAPATFAYNDLFPALPDSAPTVVSQQMPNNLRVGSTLHTQVFHVPYEERKFDNSDTFGEGESLRTCETITKSTGAHIEISTSKDGSLTFLLTGKNSSVLDARRQILTQFQMQASRQISIPKDHHRWILGKQGQKLKDLEKVTATKINVPSILENSDTITITGTKEGIEKAEHEIRVCYEEQSRKASERITVPRIYHPFIVGPNKEMLNKMQEETGARIHIPPPSTGKEEILIAGEKEGVLAAKAKIEAIYQEMDKKCSTVSVEVPKSQHKYVIGNKGSTIQEILKETGVSVEMPPMNSNTGTITLRGPQNKLGSALSMVCDKANSEKSETIPAPGWIHKYIIGKGGAKIKKLTQDFPKIKVDLMHSEDKIKIEGPPEEVERVYAEISESVNNLIARFTFEQLTVDPKYYKHIIGKNGANVNRLKDENGVVINIVENGGSNIIRIEGEHKGVANVKQVLIDIVNKFENEREKEVFIDHRYFKGIIGPKGEKIREIREKFERVLITFPDQGQKRSPVKLRGPQEDIERCEKSLHKLVKEVMEHSYVIEVPIFKQFHKIVIGKGGANLRKIRDETKTKIDLPSEGDDNEMITVTGKRENVEEAVKRIQQIHNEHANIVTEVVTIPAKLHNSLIGAGGKLIHSIMDDCGGVLIKFPPADNPNDQVTIKGPAEDVEKAKAQLLALASERQLSSHSDQVRAKSEHHKFLIGKSGANIKKIREQTGARIVFPTDKDEDKETIYIIGRQEAVAAAKTQLERAIKDIDNVSEGEMNVPACHHRHFVARRGEVLRRIMDECGGVQISFPRQGVDSERVALKGPKDCIELAKQRIAEIVEDLNAKVTIPCVIAQRHHRTVMGTRGSKVQSITAEFDVQIKFPERDPNNGEQPVNNNEEEEGETKQSDIIFITGRPENCEAAKQALLHLVPITIEVSVPLDLHRLLTGQRRRELMQQNDVRIELPPVEDGSDLVKITGTPANVETAKVALQDRCVEMEKEKEDRQLRSYELKFKVDPEYHPKVIGKGGSVVTKIRSDFGVLINFPKKDDPDEDVITVQGYEDKAHAAKDAILQIVQELSNLKREEIEVDLRVHSRLIGSRGRNIRRIMTEFNVEVKFPRAQDPNIIVITGDEDNVADAKDHILNLAEEYMQDVNDNDYRPPSASYSAREPAAPQPGFVVQGGPWEQRAPDTASTHEFPSIGAAAAAPPPPAAATPLSSTWGPRR